MKQCYRCHKHFPQTEEYFRLRHDGIYHSYCRECEKEYQRTYRQQNKAKAKQYAHQYYEDNKGQIKERVHEYTVNNKEQINIKARQYYLTHRDHIRVRAKAYYYQNKHQISEKARAVPKETRRKLYKQNTTQAKLRYFRRVSNKQKLTCRYSKQDWEYAMAYFHGCCAVCGRQLNDLFGDHTAAMDHWIPLSSPDCPGTIPENIVPLCHGLNGCNNSKGAKDPYQWVLEKFSPREAKNILNRIAQYFSSLQ